MNSVTAPTWHRESFDCLLQKRLPQLLSDRLAISSYRADAETETTCRLSLTVSAAREVEVRFAGLPYPHESGVFQIEGRAMVVLPCASHDELDTAEVRCVGDLLGDTLDARLSQVAFELPWDEALLYAVLPLNEWFAAFFQSHAEPLDATNLLSRKTHLRGLLIPDRQRVFTPSHVGRVCPIETPDNADIGRRLVIAVGASIRDGRLVVDDERQEASFGPGASVIPFLEHCEPGRPRMGVTMMRQWMVPPDPEPAWVQTGEEDFDPEGWCGRNLLTGFLSWGADTHEDALVLSASAAQKMSYPASLEAGDKLSSRHGLQGTVSRILPDNEMPHLLDGTPLELLYSFTGLPSRVILGPPREALLGRIARKEGAPTLAPIFHAPQEPELRARAASVGIAPNGLETLTAGKNGPSLIRRSAVGEVYWGKVDRTAATSFAIWTTTDSAVAPPKPVGDYWDDIPYHGNGATPVQSHIEFGLLRDIGAYEIIREQFIIRTADSAEMMALSNPPQTASHQMLPAISAVFARLSDRLAAAGIQTSLDSNRLRFRFAEPGTLAVKLALPVAHPWLPEKELTEIGAFPELLEFAEVNRQNDQLRRLTESSAPTGLREKARRKLEQTVRVYLDKLVSSEQTAFTARTLVGGKARIAPDGSLRPDELGLPEELAWALFGPQVSSETGAAQPDPPGVDQSRSALNAIMARSWVVLRRYLIYAQEVSYMAFRPVLRTGKVLRLPPSVNSLLNSDYDGDQAAVFLPITEAGQREAEEKLSLRAWLDRKPELLHHAIAWHAGLWGLAELSRQAAGKQEIEALLGIELALPYGFLTRQELQEALHLLLKRAGSAALLNAMHGLQQAGFRVVKASGASFGPFVGESVKRRPEPPLADISAWERTIEAMQESLLSRMDFDDNDLGHLILSIKSAARGNSRLLNWFVGYAGTFIDVHGETVVIPHGLRDPMTPEQFFAVAFGSREMMARHIVEEEANEEKMRRAGRPRGIGVLARALRSPHPGIVFAYAAATGESDPLADPDSRVFLGLPAFPADGAHP